MKDINIVFCGLSKDCEATIEENLTNLLILEEIIKAKSFNIVIVDSSKDHTKEIIKNFQKKCESITLINEDNLEKRIFNRIERISFCRNLCLEFIRKTIKGESLIYIPIDLDLNLFKNTNALKFEIILEKFNSTKEVDAIFPINIPFYYDIFALRAKNWHSNFNQLLFNFLKKYIPFSSFLLNYYFIYRKQLSLDKVQKKEFKLESAFSGAGLYKIMDGKLKNIEYSYSFKYPDLISEHVYFNKNFKNIKLEKEWIIEAPKEHIGFKILDFKGKVFYFLKTIKYDFLKLLNFLK